MLKLGNSKNAAGHAEKARAYLNRAGMKISDDDKLAAAQVHATLAVYELLKAQQESGPDV